MQPSYRLSLFQQKARQCFQQFQGNALMHILVNEQAINGGRSPFILPLNGKMKKKVREYDVIKQNIDSILRQEKEPERGKETERG